jgi:hypothetical protein
MLIGDLIILAPSFYLLVHSGWDSNRAFPWQIAHETHGQSGSGF